MPLAQNWCFFEIASWQFPKARQQRAEKREKCHNLLDFKKKCAILCKKVSKLHKLQLRNLTIIKKNDIIIMEVVDRCIQQNKLQNGLLINPLRK